VRCRSQLLVKEDHPAPGILEHSLVLRRSVADLHGSFMLDRQRDGIAAAKAAGKYRGRQPTALAKASNVKALNAQGVAKAEIARRLDISRASVFRILGPVRAKA
jgi:DNA invertase Pin-like site-specific DNA recombinase